MKTWTAFLLLFWPIILRSQPLISFNIDVEIDLINFTAVNYNALERANGHFLFNTTDGERLLLGELNPQGEQIWSQLWVANNPGDNLRPNQILELADGEFLVTGSGVVPGGGPVGNSVLLKYDADHELVWARYFGRGTELNTTVAQLANGDFILATTTATTVVGNASTDVLLMRVRPDGILLWAKSYGADNYDRAYSVAELENGDLLVAGVYTNAPDYLLMRVDAGGALIWAKSYQLTPNDGGPEQMIRLNNGHFVLRGFNDQTFYPALLCVDQNGQVIWAKQAIGSSTGLFLRTTPSPEGGFYTYGFDFQDMPTGIFESLCFFTNDGELIWTGFTDIQETQPADLELCANGDLLSLSDLNIPNRLLFRRRMGNSVGCEGKLSDREIDLVEVDAQPTTVSLETIDGALEGDLDISYTDLELSIEVLCIDLTATQEVQEADVAIYPNPVQEALHVILPGGGYTQNSVLRVYNQQGQLVGQWSIDPGQREVRIPVAHWPSGPYFLHSQDGSTRHFVKF